MPLQTPSRTALLPSDVAYTGYEDYNDASTASTPLSVSAGVWTNVPNNGAGAYSSVAYSPASVSAALMNSSGQIDLSGLKLGDLVLIRSDIRVTPAISGAYLEFRFELGAGGGVYHLTQPLGALSDGAREYPFQFLTLIYVGDTNTKDNLITPQIRCSESASAVNLGSVVAVFQRNA